MATQAWQMPDVDAEKYQSVTKQGGARSEITRHVLPFTTGVSVAFSSTRSKARIGCNISQQSGLSELKWDNSPMTISEVAECVLVVERVRVGNQHPINVVDVSESRHTCLIGHKECQQA